MLGSILARLAEVLGWSSAPHVPGFIPTFLESMEHHEEISVTPEQRALLLQMSPATIDRQLQPFPQR